MSHLSLEKTGLQGSLFRSGINATAGNDLTYVDLFAGAGGLSEGFYRAGYKPVAHVEADSSACMTLKTRSVFYYLVANKKKEIYDQYLNGKITREQLYDSVPAEVLESVIEKKISEETLPEIFEKIDFLRDGKEIDLIVGGPPCQAYSLMGRSRMGQNNVIEDERYRLYIEYGEILKRYKPKVFIFENVQGMMSAEKGELLDVMKAVLEYCGYKIHFKLLSADNYGVLQVRKRVILIGIRGTSDFVYPDFDFWIPDGWKTMNGLFSDLPLLKQGESNAVSNYLTDKTNDYLKTAQIRNGASFVTQHTTRPHNERDLEIYSIAIQKWIKNNERLRYSDLPAYLKTHKNETGFGDRFKVVNHDGNSHTVVAHLSKDGHYFIYPDENNPRSISVREAARIQSFPDDFFFEGGRNNAFRQIGNAVPPLMAATIAEKLKDFF